MKARSIRFKTSVLYSGVLSAILTCFSIFLFVIVRHALYQEVKLDLKVKARQIDVFLNAYASVTPSNGSGANLMDQFLSASDETTGIGRSWIVEHLWAQDSKTLGLRNDFFRVLSPRGRVRLRSENMTDEIGTAFNTQFPAHTGNIRFTPVQLEKDYFYGISYPFRFSNRQAFVLQLATPVVSIKRVLSRLVIFMIIGVAAILLMTVFMGAFLTRRILRPVSDVTMAANNISQTNLNLRIPQQKLDHEMEELINSFNRMIERLEQSFIHVNEFSSHVAHELKTPLSVIKNELELALIEGKSQDDDQRVMKVALEEIDRLIKTIKDLLLLAKLEYKLNIFKMERIDIIQLLEEIYQHAGVLAAAKQIRFDVALGRFPVLVQGDAVHLRRIFLNLLHNAVKFTPAHGKISMTVEARNQQVMVRIEDTGIGIAPEDKPHMFEKFYRVRHSNQEDMEGSGLGLYMARTIARSHGGDIVFESQINKGSTFTVVLPIKA